MGGIGGHRIPRTGDLAVVVVGGDGMGEQRESFCDGMEGGI
jgi:hypothetical protein